MILCNTRTVTNICACYNGILVHCTPCAVKKNFIFPILNGCQILKIFLNASLKLALNNIISNFLKEHLSIMSERQSIG